METWHFVLALVDSVALCLCRSVGRDIEEIADNPNLLGKAVCLLYVCVMLIGGGYLLWFLWGCLRMLTGGR